MGRVLRAAENIRRHSALDYRRQSLPGLDKDPGPLASGSLEYLGRSDAPDVEVPGDTRDGEIYTVTLMMGTIDVSRGESRKMIRLQDKVSCILEELRIYLKPAVRTICTVPYNMMADQNAREMNERVQNINEIIRQSQPRSVLPMRVLDVARMMEDSLWESSTSDGIHFDKPRGMEWLNGVFQRHINFLESDLVETGQFNFGPPPIPPFFSARSVADRLFGKDRL